jgi:hypothetical protein
MRLPCLILSCALALPALGAPEGRAPKMILGWLETSSLPGLDARFKTKLDPGAKTSSMQATNIERFERDGQPWVRFDFTDDDVDSEQEQTVRLEGRLSREVVIKRHGAPNVTRPVVIQEICLYHQIYRTEFSLADRDKFNYPILLGRSFLANVALVDSGETFLSRPDCGGHTAVRDLVE